MKIVIDGSEFARERHWAEDLPPRWRKGLWAVVRKASFACEREIKLRMPVDKGRARASWGHSQAPAAPADSIWVEEPYKLTITQGSRVEYISELNEGSSQQAPAGFIDTTEVLIHKWVNEEIDRLVDALVK